MPPRVRLCAAFSGAAACAAADAAHCAFCSAAPEAPRSKEEEATHRPRAAPPAAPPWPGHFDVTVLGSGVSTAVPALSHVLRGRCRSAATGLRRSDGLAVCEEALLNPASRNRRFNVSLLLRLVPATGGPTRHVMVDAGKTMRQAVMQTFPGLGADTIDALLVTHGHADAILGIDDLRDLQVPEEVWEDGRRVGFRLPDGVGPMRVVSNRQTIQRIRETFPYLCAPGPGDFARPGVLLRRILWLEIEELASDNESLSLVGLPVRVFPVLHGGTYVSLGFAFGTKDGGGYPFVYISDVKEVPIESMAWLEQVARVGIDLLIVDALSRREHSTHFSLGDALAFVRRLRPARALLVGMSSCELGDHDEVNAELAELRAAEGLDVQLAFDGQRLPAMPLAPLAAAAAPPPPEEAGRAAKRARAA